MFYLSTRPGFRKSPVQLNCFLGRKSALSDPDCNSFRVESLICVQNSRAGLALQKNVLFIDSTRVPEIPGPVELLFGSKISTERPGLQQFQGRVANLRSKQSCWVGSSKKCFIY